LDGEEVGMIDFNKLIDKHLVREYRPKSIGRYYPSEVGGCIRKTYFSYKIPKPVKTELIRIFEAGNMMHEFVTEVIRSEKNKNVVLLRSEMPVKIEKQKFIISGRIDNLMLLKINKNKVLVEVKSTKYLPKQANESHEMQLQLYMFACKVHRGLILYIQRDNLQVKSFDVKYSKKKVGEIMKRFEKLHSCLVKEKVPEAEAKLDKDKEWMCKYCDWASECDRACEGA
jgi:hypothetical protein